MTDARDHIDDATDWLVRLQRPEAAESDWLAFDAWLGAASAHAAAYDRVLALSLEIEELAPALQTPLKVESNVLPFARLAPPPREPVMLTRRWALLGGGLAAASVAAAFILPQVIATSSAAQVYTTGIGQRRTVTLSDGSRIDLNAASKLTVRMDGQTRRVTMDDAEAVFQVAHDAKRPFLITVGDRTVRVVGTEFDIRKRGEQMAVTVRTGLVEVLPIGDSAEESVQLRPGQRLERNQGDARSTVVAASADEIFAWRSGRLVYRDAPLTQVVADLNLHFRRPVRLADARTGATRFSGVIILDNEDAVVGRLTQLAPVSSTVTPNGVTLRATGGAGS